MRLWQQAHRYDWTRAPSHVPVRDRPAARGRPLAAAIVLPFAPEPAAEESASDDPAEAIIEGLAIRDALQALSDHRQMLELSHGQDRKQTEIAELLGLPLGTVKSRTYYALRALRLALQERGIQERGIHTTTSSPTLPDLAGYVLDALEPDERAAFEQHLATAKVPAEVAELQALQPC